MSDWKPARLVVQAIIEYADGTTREALFNIPANAMQTGKEVVGFRSAQVFVAHERQATYDMKLNTTQGTENVKRGGIASYAGPHLTVPIEAPVHGEPFVHDRLKVIPPPVVRATKQP